MMKRFFTVVLGSLAAIWISVGILFILGIFLVVAVISSGLSKEIAPQINDKSVLYIDLGATITEEIQQMDFSSLIYGEDGPALLLEPTIKALKKAETDNRIKGVYVNAGSVSGGIASILDVANALAEFKKNSGKWVVAYGDQFTQASYIISSCADKLFLNPVGMVDIHGLSSSVYFYKGLLDKLGVEIQVLKVGTFKSAVEPYMLTAISDANRMQMEAFMGSIWGELLDHVSQMRELTPEELNAYADSMLLTVAPEELVERNLVDKLCYRHEADDYVREILGLEKSDILPIAYVEDYYNSLSPKIKHGKKIAVLYAVGEISEDGSSGITSSRLVPQIEDLASDDDIEGMVFRVNSPGGSAFASEQIWEAIQKFKEKGKPVFVSMGDYAASGGYYISCGADRIYASPVTLTGSIGIYGLVPEFKGLLNKHLGITVETVNTNANGDFPNLASPMNPFQRAAMQRNIDRGYETFVSRCAEGRDMPVDSIKAIAEGRVWSGNMAVEIGLVDELGTLDDAVKGLAEYLELDSYKVEVYPKMKSSVWDILFSIKGNISDMMMQYSLGSEAYELYKAAENIRNLDPIQCRMENISVDL